MNDYISVAEFAELAGVSPQYIYKLLSNTLKPYTKTINKKKMIDKEGLKLFSKYNSTENSTNSTPDYQPNSTEETEDFKQNFKQDFKPNSTQQSTEYSTTGETVNKLISLLEKQLEEKDKQLEMKDRQIQDLSNRLAEALELTKGQQYITVADKATQLNNTPASNVSERSVEVIDKNVSFWDRLCDRIFKKQQPLEKFVNLNII